MKNVPDHIKYGLLVAVCVFFVGWSTGLGGSLLPNIGFSILMGLMAGFLMKTIKTRFGGDDT